MAANRRLALEIVRTDRTFEQVETPRGELWQGKCLHCKRRVCVGLRGELLDNATIEHLVPRSHGGGDDIGNVAIACFGCNNEKGRRHDPRRRDDAGLRRVIATLRERRRRRWRDAPGVCEPDWPDASEP